MPEKNVRPKAIFLDVSSFRRRMIGIGRVNIIISTTTETKPEITPVSVLEAAQSWYAGKVALLGSTGHLTKVKMSPAIYTKAATTSVAHEI